MNRAIPAIALVCVACTSGASTPHAASVLPLRKIADVPLTGSPTRFDYASLDANRNLLFIAHLGASQVIVFNTKTNRVASTIDNVDSVHGVLAVPALGRVYASATGTNEVDVVDERSLKVVARIPAGVYPDGMAFVGDRHKLYVSDERGETETVIDVRTNRRIATIALGGEVGNSQYDARTHRVLVNVQTKGDLVAIDPSHDGIVARYPVSGCRSNHGLLIDGAHRLAYIACEDNATLIVFDLRTLTQVQTLTIGVNPDVLAYDDKSSTLFVACESGTLSMFATTPGRRLKRLAEGFLADNAHVVAVDNRTNRIYFPLRDLNGKPVLRVMEATGR
jgi:YVTN family beta-propeller protein